ncbi:hypothetical protein EPO15_03760 [bacterium]|nr:MAG: hypothetical protein EPO15_03760 [bacterium]
MRLLRLACALLLAGSAQAQTAVSLRGVLRAPLGAPTPLVLPAPTLSAALLPTLTLPSPASGRGIVAAPAPKPLPAFLASGAAAVADFSKGPAPTREAGEALWQSVMGERRAAAAAVVEPTPSAPAPAARLAPPASAPKTRTLHLLAKPLRETVELGPVARVLHYALETGFQFVKAALVWQATGSVTAGLAVLALELVKLPPMITAQSLADLQARYWWRRRSVLKELAAEPGVHAVKVLTAAHVEFSGILARRKENTGLIFVESEGGLGAEVGRFGEPLAVQDAERARVRLTMVQKDRSARSVWMPTLAELLAEKPLPDDVAAEWRAVLAGQKADAGRLRSFFDVAKEKDLRVEASLIGADGEERPLGTLAMGRSARRLMGASALDRALGWLGVSPHGRAIPLARR